MQLLTTECYYYFDLKQQDMKNQANDLTRHRDIGYAPSKCRRRRADNKNVGLSTFDCQPSMRVSLHQ